MRTSQDFAINKMNILLENDGEAFLILSNEGKVLKYGKTFLQMSKYSEEEMNQMDVTELFPNSSLFKSLCSEILTHQKIHYSSISFRDKQKVEQEIIFIGSPYNDNAGNNIGISVVFRNMDKQIEIESQLSEYKLFFNESADLMCIANMNSYFEVINQSFVQTLGYTEEVLLKSPFLFFIHTDDIPATKRELIRLKNGIRTINFQNRYRKVNGDYIWLEWNANPHSELIYAIARDITEQKSIERNLEKSLKEVLDYKYALNESSIVEVTDSKGVIKYVNENSCKISKYTSKELIGHDHRVVNSGYHSKEFIQNLWMTINNGDIWKGEIRNRAKDGSFYWMLTTIVPFLGEDGKPYQFVAIRADITERKKIEIELLESKIKAEEAMKAKQQFLSNMSHEIRTPMNAIIGFTKVILKTELTSKQKEYLSAIKLSGDSLIVLINDILDLAKVDAGKMSFEKIPFKLNHSIDAMIQLFENKVQEKNLRLIKIYDKGIPEVLLGDPTRLHQIILNLLSNATKFTSKGEIQVIVKLLEETKAKASIEITIKDTGIGIQEDRLENIFENFQQASSGTARLYGGTGLGLAIVKKIIEAQGGSIKVISKYKEGSSFSFVLDFEKTGPAFKWKNEVFEIGEKEERIIKVLVVEDMPLNQLLMKTILDDYGFDRDIAENGQIAIEKMQLKAYDIILMDLQMPVMNGFEATDYIRKTLNSKIPIIALSADVTTVDINKCQAAGMNDYISKPVDERTLYSKIIGLVKKPSYIMPDIHKEIESAMDSKTTNLNYLRERTKSNDKIMKEMIGIYLEQTPILISTMIKSLEAKDWQMLHASIHKMIPSFSIVGINEEYEEAAKKIQEFASAQEESEEINILVAKIQNVCERACDELKEEYNKI